MTGLTVWLSVALTGLTEWVREWMRKKAKSDFVKCVRICLIIPQVTIKSRIFAAWNLHSRENIYWGRSYIVSTRSTVKDGSRVDLREGYGDYYYYYSYERSICLSVGTWWILSPRVYLDAVGEEEFMMKAKRVAQEGYWDLFEWTGSEVKLRWWNWSDVHPMVHNKINMMDMVEQALADAAAVPDNSLIVENDSHCSVAPFQALNSSIRCHGSRPTDLGEGARQTGRVVASAASG